MFGLEELRKKEAVDLKRVPNAPVTCIVNIKLLKNIVGIMISVSVAEKTSIVSPDSFAKLDHANLEMDLKSNKNK